MVEKLILWSLQITLVTSSTRNETGLGLLNPKQG